MQIIDLGDVAPYDPERFVAQVVATGEHSNVRVFRLSQGQSVPPHTHGHSDVTLFAVEGEGVIETESGQRRFPAGSLATLSGSEELRLSNPDAGGFTVLAFFAPAFPPAR
ncbi:hypothetical protein [Agromyces sp. Marseille-P2726]|uniref:hypothetical protein n=1 Tax=Agromyces sp. Marseille-P2726 TaxID=2709132 RepID=UPI00156EDD69|nr:hypothetical protein [Agromyces sp. Marseille-P2726]